ncbi:ATP-dependent DNA ligase [Sphingomonas sp. HF-S3]|uniref:DNA ligase (ATP) n=1 Tax=Sphingomonas rustica TaxID=3103142 RepID=A0ABV0B814_9SPHN
MTASKKTGGPPVPMEARLVAALPDGEGWQFEPKWDGFRAIAVRDGDAVNLWSRSGKPLDRYFPDIVAMLAALPCDRFTLDGELIIPIGDALSFAALQARLHPAASRVAKLVAEAPAQFMLFDCLALDGEDLSARPLSERRAALAGFHSQAGRGDLLLSPASSDVRHARRWLARSGGALDGVIAKRLDEPYRFGERAMAKVKQLRTADCVVGGYRRTDTGEVASLLLGLFDEDGRLDHVGFVSGLSRAVRAELGPVLKEHEGEPGFTGNAPGGPSRWKGGKGHPWTSLRHDLVAEVDYDQVTGNRFRHGTRFRRWRPDKDAASCTFDQLARELRPAELETLLRARRGASN